MKNQLLTKSIKNHEIDFTNLKAKDFIKAFEKLIPDVKNEHECIINNQKLTYFDLFESDEKSEQLSSVVGYLNHLNSVVQTDEIRDIYGKYMPQISSLYQELSLDIRFFNKIKDYEKTEDYKNLSTIRKKIIEDMLLQYNLSGINLPNEQKLELQKITFELTELSEKFENNLLDVEATFEKEIDLKELIGLPQRSLLNLKKITNEKVLISKSSGVYDDILTYCENENTRKKIYEDLLVLGIKDGYDNRILISKILELKQKQAKILGYDNYAELSLEQEMLKNPEDVLIFIENLGNKALKKAQEDSESVNQYGQKFLNKIPEFHDRSYVIEKMRKELYDVDSESIRKFFPISKVLSGLFEIIKDLYNINFQANKNNSIWHEDVLSYDILNDSQIKIGTLYLDLFKRKFKESGAWMNPALNRHISLKDIRLPVTYIICNIPKDSVKETTIEFNDVITLFHEMGHALHNILTEVDEEYFSGLSNVEHDAIELPSQFMENFCWDYEIIKKLSKHIETGETIPEDEFNKMKIAKNFLAAAGTIRQVIFSYLDMYIHKNKEINPMEIEKEIFNKWKIREQDERSHFLPSFSHIFAGGYAAGYYAYKWSEVLSADAFAALKEVGATYKEQKEMANRFKNIILTKGGTEKMLDNFKEFRGRNPDIKFLLIDYGILDDLNL
jgi:oligopeptidase A